MKTLACVTMVYNEPDILPVWLRHYSAQVGAEACYVVDHGTDDSSTDSLAGANRIRIPRDSMDEAKRAQFISEFCGSLLSWFDFVCYTDVDEMLVADPALWSGLLDFVNSDAPAVTNAVGVNVLHGVHHEADLDWSRPIIHQQRQWAFADSALCKPVITRRPVRWARGFHSVDADVAFNRLFLFHLAYADLQTAVRRQAKRRRVVFADPSEGLHHRELESTIAGWIENWAARMPRADVTLDDECPRLAEFLKPLRAYPFEFGMRRELWRVPERFKGSL